MRNSHAGTPGTPFCIPGGHIVDPATEWELVRVSLTEETKNGKYVERDGKWYCEPPPKWRKDESSGASIIVCTEHLFELEEANNADTSR